MKTSFNIEFFSFEFKKSYVGNSDNVEAQITATIQNCSIKLRTVKMITKYYNTGQFQVSTPDTVFNRMLEFVQLLPMDASNWRFCLPWIYLESLTYEL